jgi:hypothetical protein
VVAATLQTLDITKAGPVNTLRWSAYFIAGNFNDTIVTCLVDEMRELTNREGDLVLTSGRAVWGPTTSGAGVEGYISIGHGRPSVNIMQVASGVSLATKTTISYSGHAVVNHWQGMADGDGIFFFQVPNGTVTTLDDVAILLEGDLHTMPDTPVGTQAVSLEAYRWPISRRL